MADHMGAIGVVLDSVEAFEGLVYLAVEQGEARRGERGWMVMWSPLERVELWAHMEGEQLAGCTPYYRGTTRHVLHDAQAVADPTCAVDGVWRGRWGDNDVPVSVHMADFAARHEPPPRAELGLTAFTHHARCWPSPDAFDSRAHMEDAPPLHTWRQVGDDADATVMLSATIEHVERVANTPGRGQFYHMLLGFADGRRVDMVAATGLIRQRPRVGGVISGEFWLCGCQGA